ncbi:MAG: GAF domain-containing sensor histidine kinase [Stagnimonas sp.]|nr:GAF domain-containing sensor histidine kinase [Stagnimonas sp.]
MIPEQAFLPQRRAALASYEVIDTPAEQVFDDITAIAAEVLKVPIALISLVEEHRQWFKSEIGLGCRQTDYGSSICAHAIHGNGIFEIEDLNRDPRTADNPLVTGDPNVQFYAGAVLRTSEGIAIGTVCVLDYQPRKLADSGRATLLRLARQTMVLLELRRALQQAQTFEQARSHYMATVGHDLRQPLQIISASIELALRKPEKASIEKHLGNASLAVARLGRELEQLAHAGAADDADFSTIVFDRFRLDEMLDSLMPAWRTQASVKGLRLDIKSVPVFVRSDRRLLGSILGNLVGNAIKYTAVGSITVACRSTTDHSVEVSVTDTGIGMSKADRDTIFAPFKQLDAKSDGLGLGLSLVKKAADYLNYRVSVSSSVGIGSRFSFVIPVDRASPEVAATS